MEVYTSPKDIDWTGIQPDADEPGDNELLPEFQVKSWRWVPVPIKPRRQSAEEVWAVTGGRGPTIEQCAAAYGGNQHHNPQVHCAIKAMEISTGRLDTYGTDYMGQDTGSLFLFGTTRKGNTVVVRVTDYLPRIYLTLGPTFRREFSELGLTPEQILHEIERAIKGRFPRLMQHLGLSLVTKFTPSYGYHEQPWAYVCVKSRSITALKALTRYFTVKAPTLALGRRTFSVEVAEGGCAPETWVHAEVGSMVPAAAAPGKAPLSPDATAPEEWWGVRTGVWARLAASVKRVPENRFSYCTVRYEADARCCDFQPSSEVLFTGIQLDYDTELFICDPKKERGGAEYPENTMPCIGVMVGDVGSTRPRAFVLLSCVELRTTPQLEARIADLAAAHKCPRTLWLQAPSEWAMLCWFRGLVLQTQAAYVGGHNITGFDFLALFRRVKNHANKTAVALPLMLSPLLDWVPDWRHKEFNTKQRQFVISSVSRVPGVSLYDTYAFAMLSDRGQFEQYSLDALCKQFKVQQKKSGIDARYIYEMWQAGLADDPDAEYRALHAKLDAPVAEGVTLAHPHDDILEYQLVDAIAAGLLERTLKVVIGNDLSSGESYTNSDDVYFEGQTHQNITALINFAHKCGWIVSNPPAAFVCQHGYERLVEQQGSDTVAAMLQPPPRSGPPPIPPVTAAAADGTEFVDGVPTNLPPDVADLDENPSAAAAEAPPDGTYYVRTSTQALVAFKRQPMSQFKVEAPLADVRDGGAEYKGGMLIDIVQKLIPSFGVVNDYASLYPSIMIAYCICFSTLGWHKGVAMADVHALAGHRYGFVQGRRCLIRQMQQHYLAARKVEKNMLAACNDAIMKAGADETLTAAARDTIIAENDARRKVHSMREKAIKVTANSTYGMLGQSKEGVMACLLAAAVITEIGRWALVKAKKMCEAVDPATLKFDDIDVSNHVGDERSREFEEWNRDVYPNGPPPRQFVNYGDTDSNFLVFPMAPRVLCHDVTMRVWHYAEEMCQMVNDYHTRIGYPLEIRPERVFAGGLFIALRRYIVRDIYNEDRGEDYDFKFPAYRRGVMSMRRDTWRPAADVCNSFTALALKGHWRKGLQAMVETFKAMCEEDPSANISRYIQSKKIKSRSSYVSPNENAIVRMSDRYPGRFIAGDRIRYVNAVAPKGDGGGVDSNFRTFLTDPAEIVSGKHKIDLHYYLNNMFLENKALYNIIETAASHDRQFMDQMYAMMRHLLSRAVERLNGIHTMTVADSATLSGNALQSKLSGMLNRIGTTPRPSAMPSLKKIAGANAADKKGGRSFNSPRSQAAFASSVAAAEAAARTALMPSPRTASVPLPQKPQQGAMVENGMVAMFMSKKGTHQQQQVGTKRAAQTATPTAAAKKKKEEAVASDKTAAGACLASPFARGGIGAALGLMKRSNTE